jgi:signal-transduction protein with cAMP-binding, CBS, and nucleotidyltransferase domain
MAESKLLGALVATLPINEGLRPQVVQRLLKHGSISLCQEGQALYAVGTPARQVFVVVWGKAEIRDAEGRVFYARRGDLLGTEAAEENGIYRADVTVLTKSVLLSIRSDDFKTYFLKYQPVAAWVLRKIGEQFRKESGMGGNELDELDPAQWMAELEEEKRKAMKEE